MLVRVISYIITVFGTKRYKPFLLACTALVVSLAGISAITSFNNRPQGTAASTVGDANENNTKDTLPPQTPRKQQARPEDLVTGSPAAEGSDSTTESGNTSTAPGSGTGTTKTDTKDNADPTITLSVKTATIKENETTGSALTASISDDSTVQWSVTIDDAQSGLHVSFDPADKTNGPSVTFRFLADSTTMRGKSYTAVIHAINAAKNISLTQPVTVIVE